MPDKSPGPQIKDKDQYEALRDKGYSKQKSARISTVRAPKKEAEKVTRILSELKKIYTKKLQK